MRRTAAVLLVTFLVLAGCGDDDTTDVGTGGTGGGGGGADTTVAGGAAALEGRTFVSEPGADGLVAGTTLQLSFAGGELGIQAGCNQMTGGYTVEADTLVVDALAGTEMGCEPDLMEQDARLAGSFAAPVPFVLDAGILTLDPDGGETFTLTDEAAVGEAQELVGPTWTLATITTGGGPDGTAGSVPSGVTATITFAADGTYELAAGCNGGSGSYTEAGTGVYQVEAPNLTRRRCDDAAMEVESAVVAVLDGEVAMAIQGDVLQISQPGDGGHAGAALGFTAAS